MPGKDQILGQKIEKGLHFLDYRVIYFIGAKSNFLLPYLTSFPLRPQAAFRTEPLRLVIAAKSGISDILMEC